MQAALDANDPLLLLEILATLIERDGAPAGFDATVAIGVDTARGARWLRAELGRTCRAEIVEQEPLADGSLHLGAAEALAVMSASPLPADPRVRLRGQTRPITRLIERYTGHQSWLTVRIGHR